MWESHGRIDIAGRGQIYGHDDNKKPSLYEAFKETIAQINQGDHLMVVLRPACPSEPSGSVSCDLDHGWSDWGDVSHLAVYDNSPGSGDPLIAYFEIPHNRARLLKWVTKLYHRQRDIRDAVRVNDAIALLRAKRQVDHLMDELTDEDKEEVFAKPYIQWKHEWKPVEIEDYKAMADHVKEMINQIGQAWCLRLDDLLMNGEKEKPVPQIDYRDIGDHVVNHAFPERQPMYGRDEYGNPKLVGHYESAPGTLTWSSNGLITLTDDGAGPVLEIPDPVGTRYLHTVYVVDPDAGTVVLRVDDVIATSYEKAIAKALLGKPLDRDLEDYDILAKRFGESTGLKQIRPKEVADE